MLVVPTASVDGRPPPVAARSSCPSPPFSRSEPGRNGQHRPTVIELRPSAALSSRSTDGGERAPDAPFLRSHRTPDRRVPTFAVTNLIRSRQLEKHLHGRVTLGTRSNMQVLGRGSPGRWGKMIGECTVELATPGRAPRRQAAKSVASVSARHRGNAAGEPVSSVRGHGGRARQSRRRFDVSRQDRRAEEVLGERRTRCPPEVSKRHYPRVVGDYGLPLRSAERVARERTSGL